MTMAEIRKEIKELNAFSKAIGNTEIVEYRKIMCKQFEELYKNLSISNFTSDFLKMANGYQINTGNYDTFHIAQTHDLHTISCDSKNEARKFFEWWVLN